MIDIRNIFRKREKYQSIGVVKYDDKIVFETISKIKNRHSIRALDISVLQFDASTSEIGLTIIKHLNLSKFNIKMPSDTERKIIDENYKKLTGLKTFKSQMKDSLYISVSRENNQLKFTPTINGGTSGDRKGYHFLEKESLIIIDSGDFELIGKTLLEVYLKCK